MRVLKQVPNRPQWTTWEVKAEHTEQEAGPGLGASLCPRSGGSALGFPG